MSRDDLLAKPPSVCEVIAALRDAPAECDWVRQIPGGRRITPLEIWIGPLSAWVRADGFSICGDVGRGHAYPDAFERLAIKLAVRKWKRSRAAMEGQSQ